MGRKAKTFNCKKEFKLKSRTSECVERRRMQMAKMRENGMRVCEISRRFSKRWSTIYHNLRRHDELLEVDKNYRRDFDIFLAQQEL